MSIPDLLRLMSADCPRRLAARIAEPVWSAFAGSVGDLREEAGGVGAQFS